MFLFFVLAGIRLSIDSIPNYQLQFFFLITCFSHVLCLHKNPHSMYYSILIFFERVLCIPSRILPVTKTNMTNWDPRKVFMEENPKSACTYIACWSDPIKLIIGKTTDPGCKAFPDVTFTGLSIAGETLDFPLYVLSLSLSMIGFYMYYTIFIAITYSVQRKR